jgi:putative RecB family exonuclease
MSTAVLANETLHERQGDVWSYISPSRLNLWLRCPLAFKLHYIDGVRTPTSPAMFLGKQVHAGLETFYRHRQLGVSLEPGDVATRTVETWGQAVAEDEMIFKSQAEEEALKKQSVELVAAYLLQVPHDEPAPLAVEVTMQAPLVDPTTGENLGVPLLGIVDLVLPDEVGPLIIDFKTSSRASPPFEISHEVQLGCYSFLFRQLSGEREGDLEIRSLIKTKTPKVAYHRYAARDERHFRRLFAIIREYLDALDTGRFNYRPSWSACGMCDHRDGGCRDWAAG